MDKMRRDGRCGLVCLARVRAASAGVAFAGMALCAGIGLPSLATAAESHEVTIERNVAAKMRDGVTLARGCLPAEGGGEVSSAAGAHALRQEKRDEFWDEGCGARLRGDCAGRARAIRIGRRVVHVQERVADGYDTVEWAAALPYSNGKVGMFGGSYVGATQFLAALAKPPHLAGICPTVTASNYHDGWTYQGGAFEQWFNESWSSGLAENTMRRRAEEKYDALGGTKVLPLAISYPVLEPPSGEGIAPYFKDWLAHPNFDEYWKQWSIEDHYAQIQVPVLNIAAWYDIFLGGSLKNYVRLKTDGGTEAATQRTATGGYGRRARGSIEHRKSGRSGVWQQIAARSG